MNLTGFDYAADRNAPSGGLARLAPLIARRRAEARDAGAAVLLLDNGDGLQGGLMDEAALAREGAHLLMRAFARLGYDAIGLGNHDFDFGLETLLRVVRDAPCPVICTNLRWLDRPAPEAIRPWAVLDRGGWRIGLLSFLPPQTAIWNAAHLAGRASVEDIETAARAALPALRQADCDRVVVLAHSGLGRTVAEPGAENAALALAAVPGVDAVIAGHSHAAEARADPGVAPLVLPGAHGSALGRIDLDEAGGRATLDRPSPEARPDPGLIQDLAPDHAATRAFWDRPAGHSTVPLHSYLSFCAPDRGLALVACAQAAALRPHLVGTPAEGLAVLSATAPGRFGARAGPLAYTDIPAGPLRLRHLADLYAFPNALSALIVTGAQLRDWLEKSAALFAQVPPGARAAPLLNPEVPGHDFDVLHGLSYRIDLSSPPRFAPEGSAIGGPGRIRDLRLDGAPLDPGRRVVVAVNSYRASGGGNFPHLSDAPRLALPEIRLRDALRAYLTGDLPRDPLEKAPPPWDFAPLAACVVMPTGPGARAHLAGLGARLRQVEGPDAEGFLHLHLSLQVPPGGIALPGGWAYMRP